MMLWDHYVFRRGNGVHEMWDRLFDKRPLRLLYIAGRGFDVRAQYVMQEMVKSLQASGRNVEKAQLLLVGFTDYELEDDIAQLTEENAARLEMIFATARCSEEHFLLAHPLMTKMTLVQAPHLP